MGKIYLPSTKWTRSFLSTSILQTVIALTSEAFIYTKFIHRLKPDAVSCPETKTISAYLALYAFGLIYEMILVYDGLRLKNTMQVLLLCLCNICLLIYSFVQIAQIEQALVVLFDQGAFIHDLKPTLKPLLILMPCILGVGSILLTGIGWKLQREFSWALYQQISADLQMNRRYLVYELYVTLLKFDFFFFHAFSVQILVIVSETGDREFGLTAAAIPVTVFIICLAVYFVRVESTIGKAFIILLYFCTIGYLVFKLVGMFESSTSAVYHSARTSLAFFGISTIILFSFTIVNACMCVLNFHQGLRQHIDQKERRKIQRELDSVELGSKETRVVID